MIFRVDENGIVRTSGDARFTTDADGFIEIDDAIGAFEHSCGGTRGNARCVRALIAARDLMSAPRLRELSQIDVLNVGAGDADGYHVFRLARGRTRMAANAARVVDDLRPLHRRRVDGCHTAILPCRADENFSCYT